MCLPRRTPAQTARRGIPSPVVTGYAPAFGSRLLAGGRLADRFGRRQVLAVGLALFGIASLACDPHHRHRRHHRHHRRDRRRPRRLLVGGTACRSWGFQARLVHYQASRLSGWKVKTCWPMRRDQPGGSWTGSMPSLVHSAAPGPPMYVP